MGNLPIALVGNLPIALTGDPPSARAGRVLLETVERLCGAQVDTALIRSSVVRGQRLTLGRRGSGWMPSFMVPPLQPVLVFLMLQTRLPGGKVRHGPALRLLAG